MDEQIGTMLEEASSLLEGLGDGDAGLLDAYLYESRIRCGKAGCRCMNSEHRHSLWCVSYSESGKSHTRTVPRDSLREVRSLCERYRALRDVRRRLLALVQEAVAEVDRRVEREAAAGWRRFEQMKACRRQGGSRSRAARKVR
jgi:hypothetical protein